MPQSYHHLTYEERCLIHALLQRGDSIRSIAKALGKQSSTISREVKRNQGDKGYRFKQAHEKSNDQEKFLDLKLQKKSSSD